MPFHFENLPIKSSCDCATIDVEKISDNQLLLNRLEFNHLHTWVIKVITNLAAIICDAVDTRSPTSHQHSDNIQPTITAADAVENIR